MSWTSAPEEGRLWRHVWADGRCQPWSTLWEALELGQPCRVVWVREMVRALDPSVDRACASLEGSVSVDEAVFFPQNISGGLTAEGHLWAALPGAGSRSLISAGESEIITQQPPCAVQMCRRVSVHGEWELMDKCFYPSGKILRSIPLNSQECPSGVYSYSWWWLQDDNFLVVSSFFLFHPSSPLLPGITTQINHLHPSPHLRACFWSREDPGHKTCAEGCW